MFYFIGIKGSGMAALIANNHCIVIFNIIWIKINNLNIMLNKFIFSKEMFI